MKPEESVRPSIVLCGAQKVRKALLRKAGEFAVGSPKLQRAEAAISGRHMSEEVHGLHRRITERHTQTHTDTFFFFFGYPPGAQQNGQDAMLEKVPSRVLCRIWW